jgi:hypothetical protein
MITLPKPGTDSKFSQNLSLISLLSTTGKLFEAILKIVQRHTEARDLLNESQFGFRVCRDTDMYEANGPRDL